MRRTLVRRACLGGVCSLRHPGRPGSQPEGALQLVLQAMSGCTALTAAANMPRALATCKPGRRDRVWRALPPAGW